MGCSNISANRCQNVPSNIPEARSLYLRT
jgi:hypothetical protein